MEDEQQSVHSDQQDEFEVQISGPGLQMERTVGKQEALQIMTVLLGSGEMPFAGGSSSPRGGRQSAGNPHQSRNPSVLPHVAVGEYLSDLQVSNNPERIAGIVLYLKEHHDLDVVSKTELPEWFKRAGEPVPKNLNRDIRNAIKSNLISEDPRESDHYFVTSSGEQQLRRST